MPFTEDQHMIQALAAKRPNQAFNIWVLPGRPRCDRAVTYPHPSHPVREGCSISSIVADFDVVADPVRLRQLDLGVFNDDESMAIMLKSILHNIGVVLVGIALAFPRSAVLATPPWDTWLPRTREAVVNHGCVCSARLRVGPGSGSQCAKLNKCAILANICEPIGPTSRRLVGAKP